MRTLLVGLFVISTVVIPIVPAAQAALLPDCDRVPGSPDSCSAATLIELAAGIYNFLLGFAAVMLLLMLVWGGLQMIIGGLTGVPKGDAKTSVNAGKATVTNAIIGVFIIAIAYLLVNTLLITVLQVDTSGPLGKILGQFGLVP